MMLKERKHVLLFFLISFSSLAHSVTRVAYVYPGNMMRIPTTKLERSPYLFSAGFGTEIHRFSNPLNATRGVYFFSDLSKSLTLGFTSSQGADTTALVNILESDFNAPVEFGFHLQNRMYMHRDISFSVGAHDITFEYTDEGLELKTDKISFFGILGSEKTLGQYQLNTFIGFGTGGFSQAFATRSDTDTTARMNAGIFAGFILNTPFFQTWGGVDFVGEFDGSGINVGLRIPLTSDYRLSLGFTHIENLPAFSEEPYSQTHPGFAIGLDMSVLRGIEKKEFPEGPSPYIGKGVEVPVIERTLMDSTLHAAEKAVAMLRDSVRITRHELRNLSTHVASLGQKSLILEDSVKSMRLESNVTQKNMNRAMRHLSRSLRYFYSGDYREALQEVETALELNPNLALAYARRGSIYYKLGDVQRATINWNLALKIDPEYDDVRNILKALHEDRLKTTSFSRE
ncbi:MAG: tetratricopeptide repeat protein [Candidatus Marinimicrobia bacterium]|nr:tetratricopeptide repeat protein [Candidatus Neomarinimicrobiota bacterium]